MVIPADSSLPPLRPSLRRLAELTTVGVSYFFCISYLLFSAYYSLMMRWRLCICTASCSQFLTTLLLLWQQLLRHLVELSVGEGARLALFREARSLFAAVGGWVGTQSRSAGVYV